jgi:DNA recombination protein RmuC
MNSFFANPVEIAAAIGIFAAAFLIAWFWSRAAAIGKLGSRIRELEAGASGHQGVEAELRRKETELRNERDTLQEKLTEEQQRRAAAEATASQVRENLEEQKKLLDEARAKFSDAFQSLASEALGKSQQQFLELANSKFESLRGETVGDLESRKVAIQGIVAPLESTLAQLNEKISQVESSRQEAYGALKNELQSLSETSKELRAETGTLASSLRHPQAKGRWGELTLRRVVELAGLSSHCDFEEQFTIQSENGSRLRPDLVVHLPNGRHIIVDAKVPLHALLAAASATTEDERNRLLDEHARLVRTHIQNLSSRDYPGQFDNAIEFVVMFVPGEYFFSAALEQDPSLIEDAVGRRVMLASPTTLIALLQAIAYGWREEALAENAAQISELGRDLHDRLAVFADHLREAGRGLERATESYSKAVRSFNGRLMPGASKFRELGVAGSRQIEPLEPVESLPEPIVTSSGASAGS